METNATSQKAQLRRKKAYCLVVADRANGPVEVVWYNADMFEEKSPRRQFFRLLKNLRQVYSTDMPLRVIIPGEENGAEQSGGVHNRPPVPDGSSKSECPKFMSHGPCGGMRKGGWCEVYPEMMCPWVTLYFELEKIGQVDWLKQV